MRVAEQGQVVVLQAVAVLVAEEAVAEVVVVAAAADEGEQQEQGERELLEQSQRHRLSQRITLRIHLISCEHADWAGAC